MAAYLSEPSANAIEQPVATRLLERLSSLCDNAARERQRLDEAADKVCGSTPQGVASGKDAAPRMASGFLGDLEGQIAQLEATVHAIGIAGRRIGTAF